MGLAIILRLRCAERYTAHDLVETHLQITRLRGLARAHGAHEVFDNQLQCGEALIDARQTGADIAAFHSDAIGEFGPEVAHFAVRVVQAHLQRLRLREQSRRRVEGTIAEIGKPQRQHEHAGEREDDRLGFRQYG